MPQYSPPPPLDQLNRVQRYLQKGRLEFQDYVNLFFLVLAYWILRPYIDASFKKFFESKDLKEGEQIQKDYVESKNKPNVSANEIRGTKTPAVEGSKEGTTGADVVMVNGLVNRKSKRVDEVPEVPPPTAEALLEWTDIKTIGTTEGGKADVTNWLDKWDE